MTAIDDGMLNDHVAIHHKILYLFNAHEAAQQYAEQCHKKFPSALYFAPREKPKEEPDLKVGGEKDVATLSEGLQDLRIKKNTKSNRSKKNRR
jgi:hypothetical protein